MAVKKTSVLDEHDVSIRSDSGVQAKLRLLQALWREREGLPIGGRELEGQGPVPLGSRVDDDEIRRLGLNFLTPTIRQQVLEALASDACAGVAQGGRLLAERRLWSDLLSSQPLAFNLFGELAADLEVATAVGRRLWGPQIEAVTSICFEWSPGRRDPRYLDDDSAFDVFIAYETGSGRDGFVGIDVKYHENMRARTAKGTDWYEENPRYAEVAAASGAFGDPALEAVADPARRGAPSSLGGTPMQQLWFDHLLALSMTQAEERWAEGRFVLLHPAANARAHHAAESYQTAVADPGSFGALTLESVVTTVAECTDADWVDAFRRRYLDLTPVEALLA